MLTEHGEDRVVAALLSRLPSPNERHGVIVGAGGDDCAVVKPPKRGHRLLLKTDCVIEGVHFLPDTPPALIGRKALCRALSDIAATGGKPLHALITFAVHPKRTLEWASEIYAGIGAAAAEFDVAVVGGETAASPGPCFLAVSLTGSVRKDRCVTRGGGQVGDVLFVTGWLGGSFASGKHLRFEPRLAEGRWLARRRGVRAMMDLSDGLASDLPRLADASGTGFRVDADSLPVSPGCETVNALSDGEDYELLVAIESARAAQLEAAWKRRFPELPLTAIGKLENSGVREGLNEGKTGYDHFGRQHDR